VICADPAAPAVQALVRSDPAGFADRELVERSELGLPPAVTAATVTGSAAAVRSFLAAARLPEGTSVLGPTALEGGIGGATRAAAAPAGPSDGPGVRAVLRVPQERGGELARALHDAAAVRSARRDPGAVRVQIDPRELG